MCVRLQDLNEEDLQRLIDSVNACFVDQADRDYISARANYRMALWSQFYWAGMQAVEKYLKAILLFHGQSVKRDRHDLERLFASVQRLPEPVNSFPEGTSDFMRHLTFYGNNRYYSRDVSFDGPELALLDRTVWTARLYSVCLVKPSAWYYPWTQESFIDMIRVESHSPEPWNAYLHGGVLSKVLEQPADDPARQALVWHNRCFGKEAANASPPPARYRWSMPPHLQDPLVYEVMKDRVHFDKMEAAHFDEEVEKLRGAQAIESAPET